MIGFFILNVIWLIYGLAKRNKGFIVISLLLLIMALTWS